MSSKKALVTTVSLFFLFSLVALPTIASAVDCANVSVKRIGYDPRFVDGPVPIQLKDNGGTCWSGETRQFYVSTDLGNPGLAIFLTGYSLGKTFWVRIAGDAAAGSLVQIVFIND